MRFLIVFLVMVMPHILFAQEATKEDTSMPPVDVQGLLNSLINPFQSKLPPPPVQSTPQDVSGEPGAMSENPQGMIPNLDGIQQVIEPPAVIEKPNVLLEGMVWSSKIQQVIIKGQILNVGDESNGLKLINVSRDGATLQYKGKDFLFNIE